MKLSIEWLREWADPRVTDEELAERFTSVGLVVDDVSRPHDALRDVVVGRIDGVERHPNADRLTVCRVHDGRETVRVVCGAPNAREGLRAPFARVGTALPGGPTLEAVTIRGERSHGMLCSAAELGVSEDHAGLLELPEDAEPGRSIVDVLGLSGTTFEVEVPYNRPDWLSVRGVARETTAMFGISLRTPETRPEEGRERAEAHVRVSVADPRDCSIYGARVVRDVRIAPSPEWLRRRLESVGQRSINNVVDVTNYILFTYGQPIHAFDLDRVEGDIHVRRATAGETLVTLDDAERTLSDDTLVITDGSGAIALAGVMGGASTEVHDGTTSLLLESAWFHPDRVRRTSQALNLVSEASMRFARGVDASGVLEALDATARLIQQVAGGTVLAGAVVAGEARSARPVVELRQGRLEALLGKAVPEAETCGILTRLGFEPEVAGDVVRCTAPTWRRDVTREVDLIEEVARYHGYDRFPERRYNGGGVAAVAHPRKVALKESLAVWLGLGFQEIATSAFQRREEAVETAAWGPLALPPVVLLNARSAEANALRTSLLPNHLRVARRNVHNGTTAFRLVEHGKVHGRAEDGTPRERMEAAGIVSGSLVPASWRHAALPFDFFALKGFLVEWAAHLRRPLELADTRPGPPFDPAESAVFAAGDVTIRAGRIDAAVAAAYDVPEEVFLFPWTSSRRSR